jgi:hypothetical protein
MFVLLYIMSVLPKEIAYAATKPASLPKGTSMISAVVAPSNGNSFFENGQIIFDLPSRGYLVPESVYIRYRYNVTTVASAGCSVRGTPVYQPFSRLETIIGSQTVESITNYNQLSHMLVNCRMNVAQKVGYSTALGIGTAASAFTFDTCNGRLLPDSATTPFPVSAPLGCLLSNCDHLYPLKHSPSVRIQLSIDSIANIFTATTLPTSANFSITNAELCFDMIEFSQEVDNAVASMVDERGKIMIKSQSYLSSGQTTAAVSQGSLEYIYNLRLASIKSLFLYPAGTHTNSLNKFIDALDITASNGSYQFYVASLPYPPRPLSTALQKASILTELSAAFGPAHDLLTTNFAITPVNFAYINTSTTTVAAPGMFFVGVNTERLSSNSVMLSGVSSQNSPISLRVDLNTATTNSQTLQVIALYDAIIEVDVANKQVAVLQ